MRPKLFLILLLFGAFDLGVMEAKSENFQRAAGARVLALGGSSVSVFDEYAAINNPAVLPFIITKTTLGIDYQNLHEITDLNIQSGCVAQASKWGIFSAVVQKYGFDNYSELKLGVAFSRKFGDRFSCSLQGDYLQVKLIPTRGTAANISFEVGLIYIPHAQVRIGVHVFNPLGLHLQAEQTTLYVPSNMRMGLSYLLGRDVVLTSELESVGGKEWYGKLGMEYVYKTHFFLRGGVSLSPMEYRAGTGIRWNKFRVDLGFSHHPSLGLSSGVSLLYLL